jgi:hypothetical protein
METVVAKDDFLPRVKNRVHKMNEAQAEKMIEKWNEKCGNAQNDSSGPLYGVHTKTIVKEKQNVSSAGYQRNNKKRK